VSDKITKAMLARYPDMTSLNYAQLRGLIDEFLRERDKEWLAEVDRWYKEQYKGYFSSEIWAADLKDHLFDWAKGEG